MKNITLKLAVFLLIITLNSCEKDNTFTRLASPNETSEYFVENGTLHFSSDSAFIQTIDKLCKMQENELEIWETSIGFKSLRTELSLIFDKMDECNDSLSFEELFSENTDILHIVGDEILPRIESDIYSIFINREGIYYIDTVLYKVQGEKVAISQNGDLDAINKALSENPNNDVSARKTDDILIFDYCKPTTIKNEIVSKSISETLVRKYSDELTHDRRRCKLEIKAIDIYTVINYSGPYVQMTFTRKVEAIVRNYKKSWGKYRSYKTLCEMRNVSFKLDDGTEKNLSSFISSGEVEKLIYRWNISSETINRISPFTLVKVEFDQVYGQATNRGVGARWVTVDENDED